ncbi:MAG TPA: hypothetical protein VJS18_14070 [Paraburkholderia sp.]|nr:hypothetical protein [Paraburkholderia sp.]
MSFSKSQFLARPYLTDGSLVEVLPKCRPAPLAVSFVMAGSRVWPARMHALIDALTGEFEKNR